MTRGATLLSAQTGHDFLATNRGNRVVSRSMSCGASDGSADILCRPVGAAAQTKWRVFLWKLGMCQ
jgi:hypothetical protein